ncbi:type III-B CRISPR module RAMP protein Cmr4 [Candidatus Poribacteria bacterium]|nr:type III-B CRISPR module RAMP protein Cmr4 [Candidatus Poribacteria bacterium]
MATKLYWLHTLSPTHVGTGRGIGYIDLPVQRDKVTNWPLIPGSAIKGVWADYYGATDKKRDGDDEGARWLRAAFGKGGDDSSNAGSLIPTDARLVCLPVRSFRGTFAWCASPMALRMLHRDLALAGVGNLPLIPALDVETTVLHPSQAASALVDEHRIYLEDLDFTAQSNDEAGDWANQIAKWVFPGDANKDWRTAFMKRFAVLPDSVFDYLTETGTEVTARVRIDDDSKTVATGQLWNEESLPVETILAGFVACDRVYARGGTAINQDDQDDVLNRFASETMNLQIGGKATVGRGRVRCVFASVKG